MNRAVQPGLMILAAAALVIAAVVIPVAILRPSGPALKPPLPADTPVGTPPVAEADAEGDLSRAQRFRMVEQETLKRLGPGALISALPRAFVFPHTRDDTIFGIDVSHHNQRNCRCDIDWARVAQQRVAFVVAKATEGIRFRDPHFRGHWEELARVPEIYRGAYHFMSADDDPVEQANFFIATMGPLRAVDMPPVLDLEWDTVVRSTRKWPKREGDYWSQLTPNEILDRVLKWLDVVEQRTGRIPMVYTSRAWWDGRIKSDALLARLKRYPIWLSAMEEKDLQVERPGTRGGWAARWNWTLWQFTNRGDLTKAGIPNPPNPRLEGFDVNLFRGSTAEFRKAMGIVTPIVVAQTETNSGSGANATGGVSPSDPTKDGTRQAEEPPKEATKEPVAETPREVTKDQAAEPPKETLKETPKETPKSGTELAVVPSEAAKPTEPGRSDATPQPGGAGAPTEASKDAAPPMPPVPSEPPKEATKEPVAETPREVAKDQAAEPPKETLKETPKETPKSGTELAVVPSEVAKPTEPGRSDATPQPGGAGAPTEASKDAVPPVPSEPPKEATKEPAAETPREVTKDQAAEPPKETLKEAPKETPKSGTELAVVPSEAAKPTEPGRSDATPQPGGAGAPTEASKDAAPPMPPVPSEPPKEATKDQAAETPREVAKDQAAEPPKETLKETPKETPKSGTEFAVVPSEAAKPTEPGRSDATPQPGGAGAPTEASKDAAPPVPSEPPKEATKEPVAETPREVAKDQAAEPPKEPPKEISKTETQVVTLPDHDSGPTQNTGGSDPPTPPAAAAEPKEEPATDTRVAGIPAPGGGTAVNVQPSNSPTGTVPVTDAATGVPRGGPGPSPSVIEIVLPNGRVLRVHADIDPQVLMRFIALLEK